MESPQAQTMPEGGYRGWISGFMAKGAAFLVRLTPVDIAGGLAAGCTNHEPLEGATTLAARSA